MSLTDLIIGAVCVLPDRWCLPAREPVHMTRALYLDDSHERTLELAARYLRTLAAVERAHYLDDQDELAAIFAGIDPVDVQIIGQELELLRSLYRVAPIRIAAEPRAVAPLPSDDRSGDVQASSSVAFFPQSLRVPCE